MTKEITKSLSFSPKILERTDGNLQSTLGNLVADLSYEKANELSCLMSLPIFSCFALIFETSCELFLQAIRRKLKKKRIQIFFINDMIRFLIIFVGTR